MKSVDDLTTWPKDADQHLLHIIKSGLDPLCIQIDKNFIIRNYWGDPAAFQLDELETDQSADRLAFLIGFESIDEPITLKFIQISSTCVAHIHLYKSNDNLYATLFNVTDDHDYIQPIQQGANEAQLKRFYDQQLIAKLERTQEELSRKKAQIEEISQSKSHFIASMSHEFRTPITSIIGYAEILRKELSASNIDSDAALIIRRNAHFLLNMVNNILDEARLESGDIEASLSDVDLRETVSLIEYMFASLAEQKGLGFAIKIDSAVPEFISADELRLQQMLINLIGNAVKFTSKGTVNLHLEYADEFIRFKVIDTGMGISRDNQQKIFQPFQRLTTQEQGAGLGLSITQRLLEIMGGSLQVESEVNVGSTFILSLPAKVVEGIQQEQINFQKKQVLIIEDNQDISELLVIYLQEMGIDASVIANGAEAETAILAQKPDLVIMDLNLPNRNGFEITQSLRSDGYDKPIVAFSAAGLLTSKEKALAVGCDDYIDKSTISAMRLRKILVRYLAYVPAAKSELSPKFKALKEKYQLSLAQKSLVIHSTWRSCQTNNYDQVACKMLYTLTHNLAGSAGSYEFDDISESAQAVNACIDTAYKVMDEGLLQEKMSQLIRVLEKY